MSTLPPASIVAIVVGSLVAVGLLAWYLFTRHRRHSFTRVANPALDLPRIRSRTVKDFTSLSNHSISPASWPPIPPASPRRSDSFSHVHAEVSRVVAAARSTPPPPPPPPCASDSQSYFVHRMLQSRARASEFGLGHHSSLTLVQSPTESLHSVDEEADLIDAQPEDRQDSVSVYSQPSALDHALSPFDPVSRQKSSKSSRVPFPAELSTVTEVPSMSTSRPVSMVAPSSPGAQLSHVTSFDHQPTHFPLLTSANFGKESTTTGGSISSNMGSGSGRASRYPSIAPSTILSSSSHSAPASEPATDWRHPPSGLSGLKALQIGPLPSPHSPVKEHPTVEPVKQAHLREGTMGSIPEVERRTVMQGGIARIDVAF